MFLSQDYNGLVPQNLHVATFYFTIHQPKFRLTIRLLVCVKQSTKLIIHVHVKHTQNGEWM